MKSLRFSYPNGADWSESDEFNRLRQEINRLFELPSSRGSEIFNTWSPPLDIFENKDAVLVRVELPGMKKDEIEISLHEGALTITGERREEKPVDGTQTSRAERAYGRFQRTVNLPKPVDVNGVSAAYKHGILTVTLPKAEEAKPKQIQVKAE